MAKQLIVDLHIHSHFSRATSPNLTLEHIYTACKTKGINIVATGDFTHPAWFKELSSKLVPTEQGLYALRNASQLDSAVPLSCRDNLVRFIYSVEISTIYTRHGKVRKVHTVVVVSDHTKAQKLNAILQKRGNLAADGRPILGMDTEELLKIVLSVDENALIIPAHIWTPWFGVFGSKSGFNSLEEAFGTYARYIYAVESGLDSDPFMNQHKADLGNRTIISTSDAHSAQKLAREATILQCSLRYRDLAEAIKTGDSRFVGTIEFFPAAGKYHLDGHRGCNVKLHFQQTKRIGGICPVCKKPLTLGVLYRINELEKGSVTDFSKSIEYIVPLADIFRDIHAVKSASSVSVVKDTGKAIEILGSEFNILRHVPTSHIRKAGFEELAQAIENMRSGKVVIDHGYDGVFGNVSLFNPSGALPQANQLHIF